MGRALDDLVASFGKNSYNKCVRDCTAVGCPQQVLDYALFCPECWRQISSDLQKLIAKHHRPGRQPSKQLALWIQYALDELLYIRTNGRRPPAPQSFMWDDAPDAPVDTGASLLDSEEIG